VPILNILFKGGEKAVDNSSHFIHKAEEVGPQTTKGVSSRDAR
jgi:hypothetical protein